MKLCFRLKNGLAVADSTENLSNPWLVGMLHPDDGVRLAEIWESSALPMAQSQLNIA